MSQAACYQSAGQRKLTIVNGVSPPIRVLSEIEATGTISFDSTEDTA